MKDSLFTKELSVFYPDLSEFRFRAIFYLFCAVILCLFEVEEKLNLAKVTPQ